MELKFILEAILFSAQKPLSLKEFRDVFAGAPEHAEGDEVARGFRKVKEEELMVALEQLAAEHQAADRSYRLACVAGSWQFVTEPPYAPWLKALVGHKSRPPRLSQPALETLAIIAYRQPVTRTEVEQVRGVAVDGVMQTLLERGLVQGVGRAEVIGHPMTYGTTSVFLEYFGLRALEDLPAADELRRLRVEKPQALVTAEGLATTPPEQLSLAGEAAPGEASPATDAVAPGAETPAAELAATPGEAAAAAAEPETTEPLATEPETDHEHPRTPEGN